ncbi:hypothetical protein GQ44DRAFT_726753 [Phaeosphaeriaceae sp. PMI808]|nr:hypothetical protein GQ44DRAFT_726753 [Phaeosphaeriaceae sp. PMI808]
MSGRHLDRYFSMKAAGSLHIPGAPRGLHNCNVTYLAYPLRAAVASPSCVAARSHAYGTINSCFHHYTLVRPTAGQAAILALAVPTLFSLPAAFFNDYKSASITMQSEI